MLNETITFLSSIDINHLDVVVGVIAVIIAVISLIIRWRHYKKEKIPLIEFPFDSTNAEELPKNPKIKLTFSELPYIERPKTKTNARNTCFGSLVIGKPYSGKTKEAIEIVRNIKSDPTILIPERRGGNLEFEAVPNKIKGDIILFLDDLPCYYVKPKEFHDSLEKAIEILKKTCASVFIVATARSTELEKLYEYPSNRFWDNFETIELGVFEQQQTEQLVDELCKQLKMTIDADAKKRIIRVNDGTPANPVIFFNWVKFKSKGASHISPEIAEDFKSTVLESWNSIYNELSETEQGVFQALDVLQKGLVVPHKVFVIDLLAKQESIFKRRRKKIEKAIETLIEKHLIDEQKSIIRCYDAYLEGKGDFYANIKHLADILLKRSKSEGIKDFVLFSLMGLSDALAENNEFVAIRVKIARKIIELYPGLATAHNNLGVLLYNLNRYEEAEKEYREALRIKPDGAEAHNNLGILLYNLNRSEEAEEEWREALRIKPDYAEAHINLGNLLKDLNRYEEAEEEYREALRIKPDFAEAHINLGNLLKDLNRYEEAEEEYREALRIKPDDAEAHYNLGILLYNLNRYEEAKEEYREALRINSDLAEAHYNLGILLYNLNRYGEAEEEWREALRIKPDYAEAHINLGNLLKDLNRYEEAEEEYREALRIKPDYAEAHANLGILFSKTGKREEAKKELEIAKRLFEAQGREEDVKKMEELLRAL